MKKEQITEQAAKELIKGKLSRYFGVAPSEARKEQLYKAVVMSVRDIMLEKRHVFHLCSSKFVFATYHPMKQMAGFYMAPWLFRVDVF